MFGRPTPNQVIPKNIALACRLFLKYVGMTDTEIDEAIKGELKEEQMTPEKYPILNTLGDKARSAEFLQKLEEFLVQCGVTKKGQYYNQMAVGVAAEDLNATLMYMSSQGFQAWKALVNLLRFIKTGGQGRTW